MNTIVNPLRLYLYCRCILCTKLPASVQKLTSLPQALPEFYLAKPFVDYVLSKDKKLRCFVFSYVAVLQIRFSQQFALLG